MKKINTNSLTLEFFKCRYLHVPQKEYFFVFHAYMKLQRPAKVKISDVIFAMRGIANWVLQTSGNFQYLSIHFEAEMDMQFKLTEMRCKNLNHTIA